MRVRWTTPAAADLYRIVERIQKDNPESRARSQRFCTKVVGIFRAFPAVDVTVAFRELEN